METQKKVLITGCSSGFGLLAAVGAAKAGFGVVATMRNLDKSGKLKEALQKADASADIVQLDVTSPEMINMVVQRYGPFDILVNNAGILMAGSFLNMTDQEMRSVFETDYFGPVNLARAVAPDMIKKNDGLIINIASLAGRVGHPFNAAYGAAKHALIGFSRSIRLELRPFNIKIVSVEPGYFKTGVIGSNAYMSENFHDRSSEMFELNRGFFRLMTKEVVPKAGDPQKVADKIVQIMKEPKPKKHYIIGKDARLAVVAQWLGLTGFVENEIYKKLIRNTRRQQKKDGRTTAKS